MEYYIEDKNEMNENIIEVFNEKNKKEQIEIIKYIKLKLNKKKYIIYKKLNSDKVKIEIFSAEIIENKNEIFLKDIKEKEVLEKIQNIMEELL